MAQKGTLKAVEIKRLKVSEVVELQTHFRWYQVFFQKTQSHLPSKVE